MLIFSLLVIFGVLWVGQFSYAQLTGKNARFDVLSACGLLDITGEADDCADASGGIIRVYVADCNDLDIANATFDADGNITDIPHLTPSSPYVLLEPDDNDTAYYNQEGARDDSGKLTITGTVFGNFTNVTHTKYIGAEAIARCCCLIAVVEWANGFATIAGIKVLGTTPTFEAKITKKKLKATPSILSDTGENSDRISLQLINSDSKFAARLAPTVGIIDII